MSAMLPQRSPLRIACLVGLALLAEAAVCVLAVHRTKPALAADDALAQRTDYSQNVAAH